ncbi:MAG: hypothetical protein ACWA45_02125 [Flavobacteriales bacterium]
MIVAGFKNDYYPFGLRHKGYNNVINGTEHSYKYQEQELNESLGYNIYEFELRHYDPGIGRSVTLEPLADDSKQVDKSLFPAPPQILSNNISILLNHLF